jgi:hypothetical protein
MKALLFVLPITDDDDDEEEEEEDDDEKEVEDDKNDDEEAASLPASSGGGDNGGGAVAIKVSCFGEIRSCAQMSAATWSGAVAVRASRERGCSQESTTPPGVVFEINGSQSKNDIKNKSVVVRIGIYGIWVVDIIRSLAGGFDSSARLGRGSIEVNNTRGSSTSSSFF